MDRKKFKVGLVLGGGGARGLAHVGVIQALEKEKIPIDIITATSAGSFVGAFYALYQDIDRLRETAIQLADEINKHSEALNIGFLKNEKEKKYLLWTKLTDFIKKGYYLSNELKRTYLNDGTMLKKLLTGFFKEHQFHETKIPFYCIAADLVSGEEVVLKEGKLTDALMASSAIPGIFPPVQYNEKLLVDGGIIDIAPINIARNMGADFIIASNVTRGLKRKTEFRNAIDILLRSERITSKELRKIQLKAADFVISPGMHQIDWWNFSKPEQCIKKGEEAANKEIEKLHKYLKNKKVKAKWNRLLLKF